MGKRPNPILPFTMYTTIKATESSPATILAPHPIRFLVGETKMAFDVHASLLTDNSSAPAFRELSHITTFTPFVLTSVTPEDFGTLSKWLYEPGNPPTFKDNDDLAHLCSLWVAACKLGLHRKANTLLRLGMELMQPDSFICSMATFRWVFANTPPSSPLRGFIGALRVQRPDPVFFYDEEPGDEEIRKVTYAFLKTFERARMTIAKRNPPKSAWAVDAKGGIVFDPEPAKKVQDRVAFQLPVPEYLVWDEEASDLPDLFFVVPETEEFVDGLEEGLKGE